MDAPAPLTAFIPEKGQQIVRYCGYYSNKAWGLRRKRQPTAPDIAAVSACEAEADDFRRHSKQGWARLIREVYLADPLAYPKCAGRLAHQARIPALKLENRAKEWNDLARL